MSCIARLVVVRGLGALLLLAVAPAFTPAAAAQAGQKPGKSGPSLESLRDRAKYSKLGPKQVAKLGEVAQSRWPAAFADMSFVKSERFTAGGQTHCMSIWHHGPTGLEFVLVPGGRFMMGSPDVQAGDADETFHDQTVGPFLLARTECTQAAWARVAEAHGLAPRPACHPGEDLPVEQVSPKAVDAWCAAAGLALPTEVQWEFACHAGTTTPFAWGASPGPLSLFANIADESTDFEWRMEWDDGFAGTAPVASFLPNSFGLHDVHGNVWELCRDAYLSYDLPVRPGSGERVGESTRRVARGGCFRSEDSDVRASFRFPLGAEHAFCYLGFRPSRDIPWDER